MVGMIELINLRKINKYISTDGGFDSSPSDAAFVKFFTIVFITAPC
jgi:hypothetical protein